MFSKINIMEETFNRLSPFTRVIEDSKVDSLFSAIQVLLNLPLHNDTIIQDNKQSDKIGVLENVGGNYLYVSYNTNDYFRSIVSKLAAHSILSIDKLILESNSNVELQETLKNHYDYVFLLKRRFDKKNAKIKKTLIAVSEHLIVIQEALSERLECYSDSNSQSGITSKKYSIAKHFKVKDNYTPFLSTREIALLVHALTDKGLIPSYSQEKLGEIGFILFGRSSQNIREVYSQIMPNPHHHKKELNTLIELFSQFVSGLKEWQDKKS
jgi:hypothetical protein